jgi:hypothetical protein
METIMSIRNPIRMAIGTALLMAAESNVSSMDSRRLAETAVSDAPDAAEMRKRFDEETQKAKERAATERNWPGKEEVLAVANAEVKECWKAWSGRGGAFEHLKKAREKIASISVHILNIGKAACKAAYGRTDMTEDEQQRFAAQLYEYALDTAEASLRATIDPTEGDTLEMFEEFKKSSWNTYKSQVRGGLKAGFNLDDFKSVGELNKAVAQGKAGNGGQAPNPQATGGTPNAETRTPAQVKSLFMDVAEQATKGADGEIQGAVTHLLTSLGQVPREIFDDEEKAEKIVNLLNNAAKEILKLCGRATDAQGNVKRHTEQTQTVRTA